MGAPKDAHCLRLAYLARSASSIRAFAVSTGNLYDLPLSAFTMTGYLGSLRPDLDDRAHGVPADLDSLAVAAFEAVVLRPLLTSSPPSRAEIPALPQ